MHWSKGELLQHILELNNSNQLFKLKYKLETQPFCGVQQCYDLERFVFHMLTIEQRELVLTHMNKISQEVEPRIHIFTSYDYFNQCSDKIKFFLKVNSDYLTILNNKPEIYEIGLRNVNNDKISIISDIDLRIDQKGVVPEVSNMDELMDDMVSQSLADLYFRTIINYTEIFPEFIPLYIDFANNSNIILANKLYEISKHKNNVGCILDNSQKIIPEKFANDELKIYFFKTENEFIKIFVNKIL
jgi:hypothetical protein